MAARLPHERWEVYRAALELQAIAVAIAEAIRASDPTRFDQITRASPSILLNIAEGAGEFGTKDKVRFYRYAKRSAFEVASAVSTIRDSRVAAPDIDRALALAQHVVRALTRLIRYLENR
jgi:four helix bundle protein